MRNMLIEPGIIQRNEPKLSCSTVIELILFHLVVSFLPSFLLLCSQPILNSYVDSTCGSFSLHTRRFS